jgi:phage tail sheath protein FI
MNRGDLAILGVRKIYNQGDRDALTDAQINTMRVIPGVGYKIWGADTLQTMASALSNVNVRRLLNFIEKSVSIAGLYSVFNPNDGVLQAQLTEMTERFLNPIKSGRGLYSFTVVCNSSNNPPELIGSGDTVLDVYLDPVIPAKRIHLNAIVTKTGSTFKESSSALPSI